MKPQLIFKKIDLAQTPPLMSALGQKRTLSGINAMSALPPKADIKIGSDYVRRSRPGSLAMFAAIRRASSRVNSLPAERRPGSRVVVPETKQGYK